MPMGLTNTTQALMSIMLLGSSGGREDRTLARLLPPTFSMQLQYKTQWIRGWSTSIPKAYNLPKRANFPLTCAQPVGASHAQVSQAVLPRRVHL